MNATTDTKTGMGTSSGSSNMSSNIGSGINAAKQSYKDIKSSANETFGSPEEITEQIKKSAEQAQAKVKEYTDVAVSFAQENPIYIALGAAGIGLIAGAFLARRRS